MLAVRGRVSTASSRVVAARGEKGGRGDEGDSRGTRGGHEEQCMTKRMHQDTRWNGDQRLQEGPGTGQRVVSLFGFFGFVLFFFSFFFLFFFLFSCHD